MAGEKQDLRSKQFMAKVFNCSTRRIDQLKEEGIICGVGKPSKFDLAPTIQAYIKCSCTVRKQATENKR